MNAKGGENEKKERERGGRYERTKRLSGSFLLKKQ
jgi:hypothetical protein